MYFKHFSMFLIIKAICRELKSLQQLALPIYVCRLKQLKGCSEHIGQDCHCLGKLRFFHLES